MGGYSIPSNSLICLKGHSIWGARSLDNHKMLQQDSFTFSLSSWEALLFLLMLALLWSMYNRHFEYSSHTPSQLHSRGAAGFYPDAEVGAGPTRPALSGCKKCEIRPWQDQKILELRHEH